LGSDYVAYVGETMKILIFGSGGREHALAWAMAKSSRVTEIVCAPGNGGMASIGPMARLAPVSLSDLDGLVQVAVAEQADLTIVGPELPLSLGLVDALQLRGLKVFGPSKAAAMLESSKSFAKRFLQRHQIPTANYAVCTSSADVEKAIEFFHAPIVVKADGLAAGKGVVICQSRRAALEAALGLFTGKLLGAQEQQIVVEEFLVGEEVSFLCLSDGKHVTPLVPAQDHKRIGEGDTGPNTGGMGVYSTDSILEPEMQEWVMHHIARPTIRGMADEDTPFVGVLYIGLMMTARGPQVLEFNARFGDPETQAIVMRLDFDSGGGLLEALEACVEGRLSETEFRWKPGASACVIASSGGYPGSFQTGFEITGLAEAQQVAGVQVFHSGTALTEGKLRTSGGRVLGVTAAAATLDEALEHAYRAIEKIHFDGIYFRRDIGHRALNKPENKSGKPGTR
jgi:phosphoribosylamine--glycine ligase